MTVVAECSERGLADEKAWPPGFRFHPTDEELVLYYLKRKICRRKIKLDIIGETDVYKWDPEELPGISLLKTGDRQWFFFSPRDRKYPNAARSNRATRHGYWKATGKDRNITCNSRNVGVKKTLVFYKGRAPSGERTDWVMHEYTLDEEELKRCQNAQDYYALYKVYKKSGPGPKNGEQYGAPFKEEEWAEDGYQDFNNSGDREIQVAKLTEAVTSLNDNKENGQALSSLEDLEEFMKRIADEPLLDFPVVDDSAFSLPLVVYQEDTKSTIIDPYYQDPSESPPVTGTNRIDQQCDAQESFDLTQSARSQLQFYEASSEVTSAFEFSEQVPQIIQEEDFLEMNDLIGPEPTFSSTENPLENLHFEVERDGLGELDLFHDANMFLQDLGQYSIDHGTVSDFYLNELVNNNYSMSYQSNQDQENGINNQMQMHDQTSNVFMVSESHEQSLTLPNSGVLYESSNLVTKNNEDNGPEGGSSMGRFSSSLWAFVESIPTTPASASENAHRAFERMSSFSRIRLMNGKFPNGNAGIAIENRRECRNRGFFYFFSLLGVLCAILGVLIGSFRLWGGRISM